MPDRNMTRLERWRRALGMTQADLGAALDVSQTTAGKYERSIIRLSRRADTKMRELTHGEIHIGNFDDICDDAETARMMSAIVTKRAAA